MLRGLLRALKRIAQVMLQSARGALQFLGFIPPDIEVDDAEILEAEAQRRLEESPSRVDLTPAPLPAHERQAIINAFAQWRASGEQGQEPSLARLSLRDRLKTKAMTTQKAETLVQSAGLQASPLPSPVSPGRRSDQLARLLARAERAVDEPAFSPRSAAA